MIHVILVLALLVLIIGALSAEVVSADVLALLVVVVLLLSGVLTPEEAFAGFSKDVIITLAAVFVISGALRETGVIDRLGKWILQRDRGGPWRLLAILMAATG